MNARNEVVELLKRLEGEFEQKKHDLKQEGKVVDSNEDWNARMVALRAYTESAFASSFLLTQDMLNWNSFFAEAEQKLRGNEDFTKYVGPQDNQYARFLHTFQNALEET